jgi:outer membrane protein OmpA-like peptidoglycan-associated protein
MGRVQGQTAQAYIVDTIMPLQFIQSYWSQGYHLSNLSAGDYGFAAVMMQGVIRQEILQSDTLPLRQIEDGWVNGSRIQAITWGQGKWYIVMGNDPSVASQSLLITSTFPGAGIDSLWRSGHRISSIAYGAGYWVIVFSRTMFITAQTYAISDTVPVDYPEKARRKGLWCASLTDAGGLYIATANGWTQTQEHMILRGPQIHRDSIKSAWAQGYVLMSVCARRMQAQFITKRQSIPDSIIHSIDLTRIPDSLQIPGIEAYIRRNAPSEGAFLALQRLAGVYARQQNWQAAAAVYTRWQPLMKGFEDRIEKTLHLLLDPEDTVIVTNVGKPLNSAWAEWDPIPTPDGRTLIMSVRDRPGGEGRQDVFYAEKSTQPGQEEWQEPRSVGKAVNTAHGDETVDNVSLDGGTLLLSGTFPGTYGRFDIFTAERTATGWDNLSQFPRPVNSEYHDESGCLTPDGKALLFSSDRPGATGNIYAPMSAPYHGGANGNMDIYICFRTDSGWSEPVNLGAVINTPFAERSLYLHPDGRTLYFSSDGHYGLGGLDVFKTTRLREDSWTEWSQPVNLGRSINTVMDDFSYKVTVGGDTAYFAAQDKAGGLGDWDIYRVVLPKRARPLPVMTIRGKITDKQGNPVSARIAWEDLKTGRSMGQIRSRPDDGSFFIVLPLGHNYGYYAQAQDYFPASDNIDLRNIRQPGQRIKNIQLIPIQDLQSGKASIELSNVFFDTGSDSLKPESYPELNRAVGIIKEIGKVIEIAGHTDDVGSLSYNLELSRRRAIRVREYLIQQGCSPDLLLARGYGKQKPIVPSKDEQSRARNRRVELALPGSGSR